ncbi:hypothetical protein BJ508DRAFT_309720 [Ascobolus immersus RN42]|uniref:Uncharacterized protein n=1 Tax=Ascobolus immersus RN42 TaxID=1160509 RepID=A0A3N4I188_ASCIM|nr:hypothetical protein BJ508DRAFT_309720 [Ascobolus immersus RN42]
MKTDSANQRDMISQVDLYVGLWNQVDLHEEAEAYTYTPAATLKAIEFKDDIFFSLKLKERFGLEEHEFDLFAFQPGCEYDTRTSSVRYDGTDARVTKMNMSKEAILGEIVEWEDGDFVIVRPTLLDPSTGLPSPEQLSRLIRDDPTCIPCVELCEALWKKLEERQVIHARGGPASGKSTLARTFQRYIAWKQPHIPSILIPWNVNLNTIRCYEDVLQEYIRKHHPQLRHSISSLAWSRYLLIIDDAQLSYAKSDFWLDFIKSLADGTSSSKPYILLLSSYGSPGPVPIQYLDSLSVHFEPAKAAKRMSLLVLIECRDKPSAYVLAFVDSYYVKYVRIQSIPHACDHVNWSTQISEYGFGQWFVLELFRY